MTKPYVLPHDAFKFLRTIRTDYQNKKGINLEASSSWWPTLLGGVDNELRNSQISLLESMGVVLDANLLLAERGSNPKEMQTLITAKRAMMGTSLYIMSQLSSSSVLKQFLKKDMGITSTNKPSEEDKSVCFMALRRLMSTPNALEDANARLAEHGKPAISEQEWGKFFDYVNEQCKKNKADDPYANYPITSITKPFFGATFAYAGATMGALGSQLISQSTHALTGQFKLSASLGSACLVYGPLSPMSVVLFAPMIADKMIKTFCTISLAHIMAKVLETLGQGVGMGVGMPIDLSYNLLARVCTAINEYFRAANAFEVNGLRIIDGKILCAGIEIEFVANEHFQNVITSDKAMQTFEIAAGDKLVIKGPADVNSEIKITKEMIDEIVANILNDKPKTIGELVKEEYDPLAVAGGPGF